MNCSLPPIIADILLGELVFGGGGLGGDTYGHYAEGDDMLGQVQDCLQLRYARCIGVDTRPYGA